MCRVVSCGSGDQRWSTKLYVGSRKSLDDHHRSCTLGAEPKIVAVLGACMLVQPEMERWRFPLVKIPPFQGGDFQGMRVYRPMLVCCANLHRLDESHQVIPQHGCIPAEPASVSPGDAIVAVFEKSASDPAARRSCRWLRACSSLRSRAA